MAGRRRSSTPPRGKLITGPKIDADYKDLENLVRYLTPQGQMVSRKRSSLSAQRQRALKQAVKRARHLGLLPFVG